MYIFAGSWDMILIFFKVVICIKGFCVFRAYLAIYYVQHCQQMPEKNHKGEMARDNRICTTAHDIQQDEGNQADQKQHGAEPQSKKDHSWGRIARLQPKMVVYPGTKRLGEVR